MGIRNKEAVKIDDWVSDIRGTVVGWIDATDETPPDFNEEAYRLVYSKHVGSNKSWITKFTSIIASFMFDAFDKPWGFQVSDKIYPKSAIEGFPRGTTVSGIEREAGTPDKRVILKNDVQGRRTYMEAVGPETDSQRVSELQSRINELQMKLDAEEGKNQELSEQVDRESDSNRSRNRTRYGPEEYGMDDEYIEGEDY